MPVDVGRIASEHVLEIRHRALGRLIDIRGLVADSVAAQTELSSWSISENRVDFRLSETDEREAAFVSHTNLGYIQRRPETRQHFPDRASRFVRLLLRVAGYELRPVVRFGVRARVLLPFEGSFEDLLGRLASAMPLHDNYRQPFRAEVVDIGPVVIMKRGPDRIRFAAGPMALDQAKLVLKGVDGLPQVGLHLDIDTYRENPGAMDERDVSHLLSAFHAQAWEAADFYQGLIE